MNRLLIPLFVCLICFAPPVHAQGGGQTPIDDMIGIYFDADGRTDCATSVLPGMYSFYIILQNLTSSGIAGIEMKLEAEGAFSYFNWQLLVPLYIDVATKPGECIAGFAAPVMAVDGTILIMTFDGFLADEEPCTLFTKPVYFPSIPGFPCYLDGENNQIIKPLMPSSEDAEVGVLFINAGHCGPVATDRTTLDAVKSLYR